MRGATIVEGVKVTGVDTRDGRVRRRPLEDRRTTKARSPARRSSTAAASGRARSGASLGRHRSALRRRAFLPRDQGDRRRDTDLPVIRDPDGFLYYKEEVGGLVMGGFEPEAKPWNVDPIPDGFEFQLLPEDWDHFEILMQNAIHRTPCLETAEVKLLLNGPESFTLDGNFILGEAPELAGYFVCAGFNSAGIANAGGAGKLVAEWIVNGEAPLDLWDVDIRRFAPFHANRRHLADRTVETLGLHYAMRWPREELETVRPLRRSPLYDRLAAKGAVFGIEDELGARELLSSAAARASPPYTLGTPGWLPYVLEEQRACREDVVVFDQTSFGKFVLKGRDALAVLQRAVRERDRRSGRPHGLHRACSTRAAASRATSRSSGSRPPSSSSSRDRRRRRATSRGSSAHIGADEHAALVDVTGGYSVISVMGPKAEALLAPSVARRSVEGRHAVRNDEGDRRRSRARARGADELRRRPGLRALRHRRPVPDALRRADGAPAPSSACAMPATTRSTRCASRPAAARGARSCRPTRRRGKRGSRFAVKMDKAAAFIGRDALARESRQARRPSAWSCCRSTTRRSFPGAASRS